jgi:NAD(P)-dependent dehydrogenase (short-subunit alcohol dehydrogenase family)
MNKLILITGATGGVGTSVCRYLAPTYEVLAVGRDARRLAELCDNIKGITSYQADLAKPEEVERLLDQLIDRYGYIPYLINNAGVNIAAPVTRLVPEALLESIQVNALTPFRIMRRLLPAMVEKDFGRIVNITSGAPLNCFPGYGAYSASKAALNALTVTAAREHAEHNIKINLMSPGPVRSGMAPSAPMDPEVCHPTLNYLLNLDATGATGRFFWLGRELPLFPDLEGVTWLEGKATDRFPRIFP